MPRYKMKIQYDGRNYAGWQIQASSDTIQGILEGCLGRFNNGESVRVTGSGRTDAGVHAFGQVAHFDLTTRLDTCELQKAMNAILPDDIRIMSLEAVPGAFHARYSAVRRHYIYQCYTGDNILFRHQTWMIEPFNIETASKAAAMILGEHDFTSFAKKNPDLKHYRCEIYHSSWKERDEMVIYTIIGNRFLHHMVRYLTGTMVDIARGNFSLEQFKYLLDNPAENVAITKAPGQGLILKEVIYED